MPVRLTTLMVLMIGLRLLLPLPSASAQSPSFVTSAAISPSTVVAGGTAVIAASVTSATAATVLVDVEVYSAQGAKLFQQWFDDQTFGAGQRRDYRLDWAVPASAPAGTYQVVVAVFGRGWSMLHHWPNPATPLQVTTAPAPSFTSTAAFAPSTIFAGGTATITASVTSASAATGLVDVEVYNPGGARLFQQWFDDQAFAAGQTRTYTLNWAVPAATPAGTYRVVVAVFSPNWWTLHHWPDPATALQVGGAPLTRPGFVGRSGASFVLDGAPFRFVGANVSNAAGDPATAQCGEWMDDPDRQVADSVRNFRVETGSTVIRVPAYQPYTAGGTNWRSLDRVLRIARDNNLKVLFSLEDHWDECFGKDYRRDTWYQSEYLHPYDGNPLSYKEYVRRVVTRYRDDPTIFAWGLMNETEARRASDNGYNFPALLQFARDMLPYVKSLDSNHLVTLGSIGNDHRDTGAYLRQLYTLPEVDFGEFHYYGDNDVPLPGAPLTAETTLNLALFQNDGGYAFANIAFFEAMPARTWRTVEAALRSGPTPFYQVGLGAWGGRWAGDFLVDRIEVGGTVYDFADGTAQGWTASGAAAVSVAHGRGQGGGNALRVSIASGVGSLSHPGLPGVGGGAPLRFRVYVDDPGTVDYQVSLAARLRTLREIGKPLIIGEHGMKVPQEESHASRAQKMDAKLAAFFGEGGAGYLVWLWYGAGPRDHGFSVGDPLNAVLSRHAAGLRGR